MIRLVGEDLAARLGEVGRAAVHGGAIERLTPKGDHDRLKTRTWILRCKLTLV